MIKTVCLLILIFRIQLLNADNLNILRKLYYESVENHEALNDAYDLIRILQDNGEAPESLLKVYEGSLTGLKGKHARSLRKKYDFVMEALPVMEKARLSDTLNVEILFIQGTTLYYLPFFFGQAKQAEKNFHEIIRLLPEVHQEYPADIVKNVIGFLKENTHLCPDEENCLNDLLNAMGNIYEK